MQWVSASIPVAAVRRGGRPSVSSGSQSASFGITPINGFNDPVSFSVRAIDAFPGTFALSGSTLTVSASRKANGGTYRLELTARSGTLVGAAQATIGRLTIRAGPGRTLSGTVRAGVR